MLYGLGFSSTGLTKNGYWGADLSAKIRANKGLIPNVSKLLNPTASDTTLRKIAAVVNTGTARRQVSLWSAAQRLHITPTTLSILGGKYASRLSKLIVPAKGKLFWSQRAQQYKQYSWQVQNGAQYMGRKDKFWNADYQKAMQHMLFHGMSPQWPHGTSWPTPWPLTAVQQAVQQQTAANNLQTEYNGYLDKFSQWGLGYLVDKLLELGPQDGIAIARASAKDRASATAYDAQLKRSSQLAATTSPESYKFVAFLNTAKNPGIRASARELGVPDYAVVQMWDKLVETKRINPALPNFAQMMKDISLFRKGLFYAATGGQVPGTGNGDTVPAMLTPGEFVLRKSAVRALGMDNLRALNSMQYFANGGPVFSPNVPGVPGISTTGLGAIAGRIRAAGEAMTTVNVNTTINNPIAERSSQSFNQMLRKNAALGLFGPNARIEQTSP
jgi:hypothetical protein